MISEQTYAMKLSQLYEDIDREPISEGWGQALLQIGGSLGKSALRTITALVKAGLRFTATLVTTQNRPTEAIDRVTQDLDLEITKHPDGSDEKRKLEMVRLKLSRNSRDIKAMIRDAPEGIDEYVSTISQDIERETSKDGNGDWAGTVATMDAVIERINRDLNGISLDKHKLNYRILLRATKTMDEGEEIRREWLGRVGEYTDEGLHDVIARLRAATDLVQDLSLA